MGFPTPFTGMCEFKNYSKVISVKKCNIGFYDYEDIGIAYDEPKRQGQLNEQKRSILVEQKYTEDMARLKCIE